MEAEKEREEMKNLLSELESFDKAKLAYYPLLKLILRDNNVNEQNFIEKIKNYMEKNDMTPLDKKLFEVMIYANPNKNNFKSFIVRKYIINIMKYLSIKFSNCQVDNDRKEKEEEEEEDGEGEKDKQESDSTSNDIKTDGINMQETSKNKSQEEKIFELCKNVFDEDNMAKILFEKDIDIPDKAEYLQMILLFLPVQIITLFENIFSRLNLRNENGFQFLKESLSLFLKDKINFPNAIAEIEDKYQLKNKSLRCIQCYNIPLFSIDSDGIISICYKCKHITLEEKNKLKEIQNYSFKCYCCEKKILNCFYDENFLCSNCQNILCKSCLKNHFEECATIFFIPINEIDNQCIVHEEIYNTYCELCEINLCKSCCKEHVHYVDTNKDISLKEEYINKFHDKINKDDKNEKILISSIEAILKEKNIRKNILFVRFMKKVLKIDINTNDKLFDEFFGEEFNEYYSYIIKQASDGNEYYYNILEKIKTYYQEKKINGRYLNFEMSASNKYLKNKINIKERNDVKLRFVSKYYQQVNDIKSQKKIFNNILDLKMGMLNLEENKILIKCILNSESIYQKELLKLMNRSMAESIIFYLIKKYSDKLKKINLNLGIYSDLDKYFKNQPEKIAKIQTDFKNKINSFLIKEENTNSQNNDNNENINIINGENMANIINQNIDNNYNDNNSNKIIFEKQFLFFIKEQGNLRAHPKKSQETPINSNKHILKDAKNKDDIFQVKKKFQTLLENENAKKYFNAPSKPSQIFNCIFESNIKSIINNEYNNEKNIKIEEMIRNSENEINVTQNVQANFEAYSEKIEALKGIYSNIKKCNAKIRQHRNRWMNSLRDSTNYWKRKERHYHL